MIFWLTIKTKNTFLFCINLQKSIVKLLPHLFYGVDLRTIAKKAFLAHLAQFTTSDEVQHRRLLELSSRQGAADYQALVFAHRLTLMDILRTFTACRPPLSLLLYYLMSAKPRYFSAASLPKLLVSGDPKDKEKENLAQFKILLSVTTDYTHSFGRSSSAQVLGLFSGKFFQVIQQFLRLNISNKRFCLFNSISQPMQSKLRPFSLFFQVILPALMSGNPWRQSMLLLQQQKTVLPFLTYHFCPSTRLPPPFRCTSFPERSSPFASPMTLASRSFSSQPAPALLPFSVCSNVDNSSKWNSQTKPLPENCTFSLAVVTRSRTAPMLVSWLNCQRRRQTKRTKRKLPWSATFASVSVEPAVRWWRSLSGSLIGSSANAKKKKAKLKTVMICQNTSISWSPPMELSWWSWLHSRTPTFISAATGKS